MRRILIFSSVYHPRFIGGAEVAVKEITDRIPAGDIQFEMITTRTERERTEKIGNITVHRVGLPWYGSASSPIFFLAKYFFMPAALITVLELHRKNHYDATWVIMASYASAPALFFKLLHRDVPLILTLQEGDPFSHIRKRAGITYPFFKKLFRMADRIQTISKYLADWAKSLGATCPISVIPNGVDLALFARLVSAEKKTEVRGRLGLKGDDIALVTVSRLVKKNAVDDIISSLTFLDKKFKLLILGNGEEEDTLRVQVSNLNLDKDNRVIFGGFVSHSRLPEYLQSADIFVRPSRSEGLGNSFLEAMAAGIPVIATPVGGIPDFLIDGQNGLFCEVNNPRSIAQKVMKLSKDAESRDYIVRNAKNMIAEKYQWDKIVTEMKDILMNV